ncbi:hypothetical protein CNQ87_01890 [Lysinibacillus fusiformis]|uniref:hypothetical protein n=1 Tax=Lysinibacillus fusiformis TaxID=28031 RepID=UPI000BBA454C|nr:hypothetical protein [Lysinibacillus fusiformis]PCD83163.1 hypothetical protein CNQ87_01890 [Lysinibacillus fusiformis]
MEIINNNSFEKYLTYLNQAMPHSPWVRNDEIQPTFIKVFNAIQENLVLTEINTDNAMYLSSEPKEILFGIYKENILSILLSWPTNHPGFISYNIRTACETLLKLVHSHLFIDKSYEQVSRTSFRHLKEDNKKETEGIVKDSIIKLCKIYGESSRKVHGHSASYSDGDLIINNYFENIFDDIDYYADLIFELTDQYFILNKNLFGFSVQSLRVDQRIKIRSNISEEKLTLLN